MQKNEKIDILSLVFMPFTGNKSPVAKKGSDEWQCTVVYKVDIAKNFLSIFPLGQIFSNMFVLT